MRTGIANLPLHGGKAPRWLFERMVRLAREVTTIVVVGGGRPAGGPPPPPRAAPARV